MPEYLIIFYTISLILHWKNIVNRERLRIAAPSHPVVAHDSLRQPWPDEMVTTYFFIMCIWSHHLQYLSCVVL